MTITADFPLLRFVRHLSVAHHVPGRIRLKLTGPVDGDLKALGNQAKSFANGLAAMAGIRSVALNPLAKSCTIEYDTCVIPASAWSGLLSGNDSADSQLLLQSLILAAKA